MNKSQQRTNCLLTPVHGLSCYDPLINDLNAHRVCSVYGMDDSQRAHFLSALARDTGRGMIILVPNDQADQAGTQVVGHCANDTFKILYTRTGSGAAEAQ